MFRLGDFYEAFHEDARIVSEVCGVVLTSRPVKKGTRVPMAGVPYHAADGYIASLVRAGHAVAIVEQVGPDPNPAKRARMSPVATRPSGADPGGGRLAHREVVRVVTAGTLLEEEVLDPRANNFIAAMAWVDDRIGVAHADVSTGALATTDMLAQERTAADELARLRPAEIVVSEDKREGARDLLAGAGPAMGKPAVATVPGWHGEPETASQALMEHFGVQSLAAYGCEGRPAAIAAAGLLVEYLASTQMGPPRHIAGMSTYDVDEFMHLDAPTRRNLELTTTLSGKGGAGTLLAVLDLTLTPMGARLLRRRLEAPLVDVAAIARRLDAVDALLEEEAMRAKVRDLLRPLPDIERLSNRVAAGYAGPRELLKLAEGLSAMQRLVLVLASSQELPAALKVVVPASVSAVAEDIRSSVASEAPAVLGVPGVIRRGHSDELDAIHASVAGARRWIAGLETEERGRTGIKALKVGYNKVFGYYVEVPKAAADRVPPHYQRRQTLTAAERYVTEDLKAREEQVLQADERTVALERQLYAALLDRVAGCTAELLAAADAAARVDVAAALAEVARRNGYSRPEVDDGRATEIVAGRHPVVEHFVADTGFVPNDLVVGPGEIVIVTGPNMAGKSTVLRQVALITLMAQAGSFVPARRARLGAADRVFARIGAQDDLALGRSTFMVEMVETARILHHATERSLVVLDELGRGTSTYDGMALAWAVVEALHDAMPAGSRTLFATHYHELTSLEERLERVRNAHMAVEETPSGVAFLHRLAPGPADRSYGVHVAELAGLPQAVTRRAWEILERLEREGQAPLQPAGRRRAGAGGQLALFAPPPAPDPLVDELAALDCEAMTPLQALIKLADFAAQARARGGPSARVEEPLAPGS